MLNFRNYIIPALIKAFLNCEFSDRTFCHQKRIKYDNSFSIKQLLDIIRLLI